MIFIVRNKSPPLAFLGIEGGYKPKCSQVSPWSHGFDSPEAPDTHLVFGGREEIYRFCSGFSLNLTAMYFPPTAAPLFCLPLSGINAVSSLIPQVSGRNVEKTGCHFPNQGIIYPAASAAAGLKKTKAHLQSWEVQCLRSSSEMMLFRAGGADFPPAPL